MGEVWVPEAETLNPAGSSGTMSGVGGPRATLHCTVSAPGSFSDMHRVLTSKKAEPHFLYDFKSDRLGQYFALNRSGRALMSGTHAISHNKMGTVNIQIEVCASTDDWTIRPDWHPGPNFRAMMRAIRSWGIAPVQVAPFAQTSGQNVRQSWTKFSTTAGGGKWWGHCHIPDGESHWDPGRVNWSRFIAAGYPPAPAPTPEPTPTKREVDMVLVKWDDAPEVYSSDGIHRRHVKSQRHLDNLKRAIRDQGGTGTVTVFDNADDLEAFGPIYPLAVQ